MAKAIYSSKIEQKINVTDTTAPDSYAKLLVNLANRTMVPMYPNHQKRTMERK